MDNVLTLVVAGVAVAGITLGALLQIIRRNADSPRPLVVFLAGAAIGGLLGIVPPTLAGTEDWTAWVTLGVNLSIVWVLTIREAIRLARDRHA